MSSCLEQLQKFTTIVADTGAFNELSLYHPQDATTNPSLILKAATSPEYQDWLKEILSEAKKISLSQNIDSILDAVIVLFGVKILSIIPGRVSTEIDASLSFDTEKSIAKAKKIISFYESLGINKSRILIKIASTWQGILAMEHLEASGIHCNMTLIFDPMQAYVAMRKGATLISPFVGRVSDWYKALGKLPQEPEQDPGVLLVKQISDLAKKEQLKTQVMGASFRSTSQILQLAGCELLTISPTLLKELSGMSEVVKSQIGENFTPFAFDENEDSLSQSTFLWHLNNNPMATDKLSEGIRLFDKDTKKLKALLKDML